MSTTTQVKIPGCGTMANGGVWLCFRRLLVHLRLQLQHHHQLLQRVQVPVQQPRLRLPVLQQQQARRPVQPLQVHLQLLLVLRQRLQVQVLPQVLLLLVHRRLYRGYYG